MVEDVEDVVEDVEVSNFFFFFFVATVIVDAMDPVSGGEVLDNEEDGEEDNASRGWAVSIAMDAGLLMSSSSESRAPMPIELLIITPRTEFLLPAADVAALEDEIHTGGSRMAFTRWSSSSSLEKSRASSSIICVGGFSPPPARNCMMGSAFARVGCGAGALHVACVKGNDMSDGAPAPFEIIMAFKLAAKSSVASSILGAPSMVSTFM